MVSKKKIRGSKLEFAFILAKELGKSIRELFTGKPGMNLIEFIWWNFYYYENPFGEFRKDLQMALLSCNVLAPYSKEPLAIYDCMLFPPEDFTPKFPSKEELAAKANMFFGE